MENVDAYAYKMLTRTWLDELSRPWRRERSTHEVPETGLVPGHQIEDREALGQLLSALGKKQRAVLILRYYLNLSVDETAEILGITSGTVKSQSARGLETLRTLAGDVPEVSG
jgi:RNA polymerase sigma factor (sigma-70 family)